MAAIEMLEIEPAEKRAARVIVNSRTGTVVISSAVRLAPAAISHGSLVVRIARTRMVVQPEPFSRGRTEVEESSTIELEQPENHVSLFEPGASLAEVVDALNMLGASPADLVAILERSSRPVRSRPKWW
jgi:flagellar P-ring protein precursor FlgI